MQGMRTTYVRALHLAGAAPLLIPVALDETAYRRIFEQVDGIFLPGGPDITPACYGEPEHTRLGSTDSARDRMEMLLTRWAIAEGKPLFGVCRGQQVLNVALGGSLYQDVEALVPDADRHDFRGDGYPRDLRAHAVHLYPGSRVAHILGPSVMVNSLHHQAIRDLGAGVRVVGRSPGGVVEAIEIDHHPYAMGVQWHPEELIDDPAMLELFRAFVQACQPALHPTNA